MSELPQACQHPSKEEILALLKEKFPNWKVPSVKELEGQIMKHYKGAVNPAAIREAMHQIVMDENNKLLEVRQI